MFSESSKTTSDDCSGNKVVRLSRDEAYAWVGNFVRLQELRSQDRMYVRRHGQLWRMLGVQEEQDRLHVGDLKKKVNEHLAPVSGESRQQQQQAQGACVLLMSFFGLSAAP